MNRNQLIKNFLNNSNIGEYSFKKIAGDASFRSYYRVFREEQPDLIIMDAPPEYEDVNPFIKIDEILRVNGFLAPEIHAIDYDHGFLLLEDFGDISYNKALKDLKTKELEARELGLYKKACDVLVDLHKVENLTDIPPYDKKLLMREVMLFIDWYLPHILKKPANKEEIEEFKNLWSDLFKKLSNDKKLVLRDYHADNLFVVGQKVGLIDFQDAVLGSKAYDLVSLLEDARRDVSDMTVKEVINYYLIKSQVNEEQFLNDYQILSLQRNIKIIGIFSRLAIRDGKENYLKLLPRMFKYVIIRLQGSMFIELKEFLSKFDLK